MSDVDEDGDSVPHDCIWRARAEAAEAQVAALTASLAEARRDRVTLENLNAGLVASLAELRKRMDHAEFVIRQARLDVELRKKGLRLGDRFLRDALRDYDAALASPPSPSLRTEVAPPGEAEPATVERRNLPACSPSASDSAPPSPSPVESKPKDSHLIGGDEFYCCKDQDNPCHPIRDYCSTGRARLAAPVESKPCASPCRKDGCPIHDSPGGCFLVGESKPKDAAWACEKHETFGPSYLKCSFCADEPAPSKPVQGQEEL